MFTSRCSFEVLGAVCYENYSITDSSFWFAAAAANTIHRIDLTYALRVALTISTIEM